MLHQETIYERLRDQKGRHWLFQIARRQQDTTFGLITYDVYCFDDTVEYAEVTVRSAQGNKTKTFVYEGKQAENIYKELKG